MNTIAPTEVKMIKIEGKHYYSAFELRKYDPTYFFGCSRTPRTIIKKKNISKGKYVYANHNKKLDKWLLTDQDTPPTKAVLLLSKKWVIENVPKMMSGDDVVVTWMI